MSVSAVPESGGRSTTPRKPQREPGPVEALALQALGELDTDHAAADLLIAMGASFAQDMDDRSIGVRDRVAASRELRDIIGLLDPAIVPPKVPGRVPAGGAPDASAADDDDPFEIGSRPPELGDPSQPAAS